VPSSRLVCRMEIASVFFRPLQDAFNHATRPEFLRIPKVPLLHFFQHDGQPHPMVLLRKMLSMLSPFFFSSYARPYRGRPLPSKKSPDSSRILADRNAYFPSSEFLLSISERRAIQKSEAFVDGDSGPGDPISDSLICLATRSLDPTCDR